MKAQDIPYSKKKSQDLTGRTPQSYFFEFTEKFFI